MGYAIGKQIVAQLSQYIGIKIPSLIEPNTLLISTIVGIPKLPFA
jgi:hypothetical protein